MHVAYTGPLDRKGDEVRRYRRDMSPVALLGFLCLGAGVQFFADPSTLGTSSVGKALTGPLDEIWSALYIAGGGLLLWGCLRPSPRAELSGHTLVLTALVVNGVAILGVRGLGGFATLPAIAFASWVVCVRITDLRALDRGRPARRRRLPMPPAVLSAAPVLFLVPMFAQGSTNTNLAPVIAALLGGGIITALVQAFLWRSNRDELVSRAARQAVGATSDALRALEARNEELSAELKQERDDVRALRAEVREQAAELSRCHDEIGELRRRLANAGA